MALIGVAIKTRERAHKPPTHCVKDRNICIEDDKDSGSTLDTAVVVIPAVASHIPASKVWTIPLER